MWRPVRSKPGPGCLHSHAGVKFLNSLLLFGGEREGQTLNELWKFHFGETLFILCIIFNNFKYPCIASTH